MLIALNVDVYVCHTIQPSHLLASAMCSCPWVKWPRREGNHSSPSNTDVKNERNRTPAPSICLRGRGRR